MGRSSRWARIAGGLGGALASVLLPALAAAQEGQAASRALEAPDDAVPVLLVTGLGLVVVGIVATLGYLFRRENGLEWDFQRPETQDGHGEHH